MRVKLKLIGFMLALLCAACLYTSFMCYIQVVDYQQQIVNQNKRIDEATAKWIRLNEEDIVLIQRIEEQDKHLRQQDDRIRVQDALITEMRIRTKRK